MKNAYEKINNSNGGEHKEYKYTIQNTMRRIYETFFSNTCGLSNFNIVTMFENAGKDKEAKCFMNLIEWLNEGSHSADMNDFKDVPNDAVIQMYMNIFEETFRITGNWGQYQRLMNI
jgi:wobble nucleotide-excising tRNase